MVLAVVLAAFPELATAQGTVRAQDAVSAPAPVVVSVGVGVARGTGPLSVSAQCPDRFGEAYRPTACQAGVVGSPDSAVSTIHAVYPPGLVPLADMGLGVRLARGSGLALAGQWARRSTEANVSAELPPLIHPDRGFRAVAGTAPVDQERQSLHLGASWSRVLGERTELSVSAGPSWFRVRQELVTDVSFTERYPFDAPAFGRADSTVGVGGGFGWHAALDMTWWLGRRLGAGALVRYTSGEVLLDPGRPVGYLADPVPALQRGVEVVGGFRVRF